MHFPLSTTTLALAAALLAPAFAQEQDCTQVVTVAPTTTTTAADCIQTVALPASSSSSSAASSSAPAAASSGAASAGTLNGANLVVLPLGDSITYGFGSSDGNGYRSALYDELVGAGAAVDMVGSLRSGSMADPDNEGHSGWVISQIAAAAAQISSLAPNVVLVHAGTNDGNGGQNYAIGDALTTLLKQITGEWPDAAFLVAKVIPSSKASTQANLDVYNAQIPDIVASFADAGVKMAVVDMDTDAIQLGDQLHPSDAGYVTMAGIWFDAVEAAAAQGWL